MSAGSADALPEALAQENVDLANRNRGLELEIERLMGALEGILEQTEGDNTRAAQRCRRVALAALGR